MEAGGYTKHNIGEDMELVVKLHKLLKEKKSKNRIEFVPDPVCWTEAPQDLGTLRKQRRRWHQGLITSLWKHRKMTLNPKYGGIGMVSFPYFWLVECFGPVIELLGYMYITVAFFMGSVYFELAILLTLLFVIYGAIFSAMAILLEAWSTRTFPRVRDVIRIIILALTEIFWYKPLTLIWRCEGFLHFLLGKNVWGTMQRKGLSQKELQR